MFFCSSSYSFLGQAAHLFFYLPLTLLCTIITLSIVLTAQLLYSPDITQASQVYAAAALPSVYQYVHISSHTNAVTVKHTHTDTYPFKFSLRAVSSRALCSLGCSRVVTRLIRLYLPTSLSPLFLCTTLPAPRLILSLLNALSFTPTKTALSNTRYRKTLVRLLKIVNSLASCEHILYIPHNFKQQTHCLYLVSQCPPNSFILLCVVRIWLDSAGGNCLARISFRN